MKAIQSAIALMIGLVFQFSQVLPGMAGAIAACGIEVESCECCGGLDSCPCAEQGEPTPKPLPLAPDSGQNLKAPLAKTTGTRVPLETISILQSTTPSIVATPISGPWTGYTGVPLSVAFCSFVI